MMSVTSPTTMTLPPLPSKDSLEMPRNRKRPNPSETSDEVQILRSRPVKRSRNTVEVHHGVKYKQSVPAGANFIPQDAKDVEQCLESSIAVALKAAGFDDAWPSAMSMFRSMVEDYMLGFLKPVQQSMAACRREQPTPQDFDCALSTKVGKVVLGRRENYDLESLRSKSKGTFLDSLKPYLGAAFPPNFLAPKLPTPPPEDEPPIIDQSFLGELSGAAQKAKRQYVPSQVPAFPNTWTYKSTPSDTARERDPQKIRELAFEQSKLGEEALRRYYALCIEKRNKAQAGARQTEQRSPIRRKTLTRNRQARRDELYEELLKEAKVLTHTADYEGPHQDSGIGDSDDGFVAEQRRQASNKGVPKLSAASMVSVVNDENRRLRRSTRGSLLRAQDGAAASLP